MERGGGTVDAARAALAQMVVLWGEAFRRGELQVLQSAFTRDVVLEVAGTSRLSGTYRGWAR